MTDKQRDWDEGGATTTYISLMHEIKRRHYTINAVALSPDKLMYKAVVIDHCYLQFRKILELIAFATLSAAPKELPNPASEYHAVKVLRLIERRHGNVYPRPVDQIRLDEESHRFDEVTDHLTRDEFEQLYNFCGDVLHTRNPFRKPKSLDAAWEGIPKWVHKIRRLLQAHIPTIVGDPHMYLVQMGKEEAAAPTITKWAKLRDAPPAMSGQL